MLYLDSSVLVAYYIPEAKSPKVEKAISRQSRVAISPLSEVEMFSALGRRIRTGELDVDDARRIAGVFELHLEDMVFEVIPVSTREYRIAREWIAQFSTPLRTLDALHLATAFSNDLTLMTADRKQADSAEKLAVSVKFI